MTVKKILITLWLIGFVLFTLFHFRGSLHTRLTRKTLKYWKATGDSITDEGEALENRDCWELATVRGAYRLSINKTGGYEEYLFSSGVKSIKNKGFWSLDKLMANPETAPYFYDLTEKGLLERAKQHYENKSKEAEALRQIGENDEADKLALSAKDAYDKDTRSAKSIAGMYENVYRFEKPLVTSPEETISIARNYLEYMLPDYDWVFDGFSFQNFIWDTKNCISVADHRTSDLSSYWSRIENGIRISAPVNVSVNMLDRRVHAISIPNGTLRKLPSIKMPMYKEEAELIAIRAFLKPGGVFDQRFKIKDPDIQNNRKLKEKLFYRYFTLDKNQINLRFMFRDLELEKSWYSGGSDLRNALLRKRYDRDVLTYECRITYKKKSFCDNVFEVLIDVFSGEVLLVDERRGAFTCYSKYLQEYYKEVEPETIRNKSYYRYDYKPHAEIDSMILTELLVKKK